MARKYVPVRVTDMSKVDLERYVFDYDLTFAALLMSADGYTFHRYGGRDHESPMSWMNLPALIQLMNQTLEEFESWEKAKDGENADVTRRPPRTIFEVGDFAERRKGKKPGCVHCHEIQPALHEERRQRGDWERDDIWIWPEPERIGLSLDPKDPPRILSVDPTGPAAAAGLKGGDRIRRVHAERTSPVLVGSIADLQYALDRAPKRATKIRVSYLRGEKPGIAIVALEDGWKAGTPLTFSWRPSKWPLDPAPGFGGKLLSKSEREKRGIESEFALRVTYIVNWGHRAFTGRTAMAAGIRKGDVVLSLDGKDDFQSHDHFHSWFRLTREVGKGVRVVLLRGEKRVELELPVVEAS